MESVSAEILTPALQRIDIDCAQQEPQIKKDHDRIINLLESRGMRWSGDQLRLAAELCVSAAEVRAMFIWGIIKRFIHDGGVRYNLGLRDELAQYVRRTIEARLSPIRAPYERACMIAGDMGRATEEMRSTMEEGISLSLDKVDTEIDAFILALKSRSTPSESGTTLNFHAPVGAVQSGPGATATVSQSINSSDQASVLEAIKNLERSIREQQEDLVNLRTDEILEILVEARQEFDKPTRNMTRLGSLLQTAAVSVSTTASLQPAFTALKSALTAIGIPIP